MDFSSYFFNYLIINYMIDLFSYFNYDYIRCFFSLIINNISKNNFLISKFTYICCV